MIHIDRRILGSIAWLALAACGAPETNAPANVAQGEAPPEINQPPANITGNEASVAPHQGAAQVEPRPVPASRPTEQTAKSRPSPPQPVPPPVIQRPATPPREVRPPEIHPPHRDPGDEVPR